MRTLTTEAYLEFMLEVDYEFVPGSPGRFDTYDGPQPPEAPDVKIERVTLIKGDRRLDLTKWLTEDEWTELEDQIIEQEENR